MVGLKVPGGQLEQDGAPSELYVPAAQLIHAAMDVLPELGFEVPAGQEVHVELPPALKVPAAHAEQEAAPSAKVPDGQDENV